MMTKKKKIVKPRLFEGLPVVESDEDVDLIIKKQDVEKSKKKDPANCAAALAGKREFHTDVRVFLTRTYIKDEEKKRWIKFVTPIRMTKEIISFDRSSEFTPGEYSLKAIPESARRGYKPTGPKHISGKEKRKYHTTANVRLNAREY